ncbi:hypothetical protein T05_8680 [Trichinella murrelli]|uniref:Uncharacterized protein n=1 Tax=Trichinella murrelli TaxID=144512 RepID=A0A0V0SYX2_9BILA|nr:hypothetical protein T05_8680 [Trichinella murrelli]
MANVSELHLVQNRCGDRNIGDARKYVLNVQCVSFVIKD